MSQSYLKLATENFQEMKQQAEKAMEQLTLEELQWTPNAESNSIDILVRHMSGNLRSRFSDFLTTDGEKPTRNRDQEFEGEYSSKEELFEAWNSGWNTLFETLSYLEVQDLGSTVYIRKEPHTVMEAIQRQIVHQSGHVGQIVYIAKMIKNNDWKTLSIPRGESQKFNEELEKRLK